LGRNNETPASLLIYVGISVEMLTQQRTRI
jgi:hypothetical protein